MKKTRKVTDERVHFYYKRDKDNNPLVTVCLIHGSEGVGRGVAVCSPEDNPVKKIGREYAKRRALKAYWEKQTSEPITQDNPNSIMLNVDTINTFWGESKIWHNPILTEHEKNIIAKSTAI